MIRQAVSAAMRWISDESVVLLPEPVIPVTSTSPCRRSMMSRQMLFGKPICSTGNGCCSNARTANASPTCGRSR